MDGQIQKIIDAEAKEYASRKAAHLATVDPLFLISNAFKAGYIHRMEMGYEAKLSESIFRLRKILSMVFDGYELSELEQLIQDEASFNKMMNKVNKEINPLLLKKKSLARKAGKAVELRDKIIGAARTKYINAIGE